MAIERIGFVGLGKMGGVIAPNLVAAGYEVSGFDLDRRRVAAFVRAGGRAARSARQAAEGAEVVMLTLPSDAVVEEAVRGENGVRAGIARGGIVADLSTVLPETSRRVAAALKKGGVTFLDAPISGNRAISRERGGTVMVGGPRRGYERCLPVFRAMSRRQFHMGASGTGALAKLVVNVVSELNRTALAEGLNLGLQGGIDGKLLLEVLASGSAYSKQIDHKGERMIQGRFGDAEAATVMCIKDAEHMLHTGRALGAWLPLTALRLQLYQASAQMGHDEDDPAGVIDVYRRISRSGGE